VTSVIGHEDNHWSSATMINGKLIEQHKDRVQDIHQHATSQRLWGNTKAPGAVWVGDTPPTAQQVEDAVKSEAVGQFTFCGCASVGKTSVTCDTHLKDNTGLGVSWAPPVSQLELDKSLLKELNKPQVTSAGPSSPKESKTATSPKSLDSSHKIPVNLCPASAIIAIALVIAQGHKKPGRSIFNWRTQPISYLDYHAAALRHLLRSIDGHDYDTELSELAGVPVRHDWAAMSCLAIIEDARQAGTLVDDRPVKGGAEEFLESLMIKKDKI
jgi:hypothetical protein